MDETTCPGNGIVLLTPPVEGPVSGGGKVDVLANLCTNEVYGTDIILHGVRPNYDFLNEPTALNRGITTEMGFNSPASVAPGQLGMLTFDLPTWGIVDNAPGSTVGDANFVTVFNDWVLHYHGDSIPALQPRTGILYVFGYDPGTQRALLGGATTYVADDEIVPE